MSQQPDGIFSREDWPDVTGGRRISKFVGKDDVEFGCDVVVVGSGAGGAVVAAELAEGGLDVIVLEEGSYYGTEEFSPDAATMVRKLYRDGGLTFALGSPPIIFAEGRCVGGTTVVNGGMTYRTPEKVLERWRIVDGVERIRMAEMDRYFARVEKFICAGPQDSGTSSEDNELFKIGAEKMGWKIIENIRNQFHCAGANNCAFGCPTGAKRSTLVSYIPRALAFGARVYADCKVDRVITKNGNATGVTGVVIQANGDRGHRFVVRAKRVVLAAGAMQTPGILLRSNIRTPSKRVGYNLALHPNVKLISVFDHNVEGWKGAHQMYQVRQFRDEGLMMAAVNLPPSMLAMSLSYYGRELGAFLKECTR
ncbi:MAG: FAD-dependent oxidoreductase, partial [Pseudomonadota bacterium]